MAANNKHGLGRGLGALFGDEDLSLDMDGVVTSERHTTKTAKIEDLIPGKYQPRQTFAADAINALADSIKEKGVLQPILVRKSGEKYEIIAGERRYRAARQAGLTEVPVIEKNMADNEVLEVALVENIVRQDLTALEEASGFEQLIKKFSYTQEKLSEIIGKSRSYITNSLRLLTLPDGVKVLLNQQKLTPGHARALVGRADAEQLAQKIVAEGLNVRQVEALVAENKDSSPESKKPPLRPKPQKDADLSEIENSLSQKYGLKVQINTGKNGRGKIVLAYKDLSQLEKIIEKLEN